MIRNVPTPARASSPASAEPVAPQPTMATRDSASLCCPCSPIPWNRICREYRLSKSAPNSAVVRRGVSRSVSCAKGVTSPKLQNLYYKLLGQGSCSSLDFTGSGCRKMIAFERVVENHPMKEGRPVEDESEPSVQHGPRSFPSKSVAPGPKETFC